MAGKTDTIKTSLINELLEDLHLQKYEFEAEVINAVKSIKIFEPLAAKAKNAPEQFLFRKSIDIYIEKKAVFERSVNALQNNIDYYKLLLKKNKKP